MSNKMYDILKYIAQIVLPAIATLYLGLADIWGLPCAEQVVGTITAINTFLGVILGISSNRYSGDGTFEIESGETKDVYRLNLNDNVTELQNKKTVIFKVDNKNGAKR